METVKSPMEMIYKALSSEATDFDRAMLGNSIYSMFREYYDAYQAEWERMRRNDKLYQARHWDVQKRKDALTPEPVTPIIHSTIENIKADLLDEIPCAVIKPESDGNSTLAKALTKAIEQDLDASDFKSEYDSLCDDYLIYGWCVSEVQFDFAALQGHGCSCVRRVAPYGFMCDPCSENLQNGRIVFKFSTRSKEWFMQHYPDKYENISFEKTFGEVFDITSDAPKNSADTQILIEAWIKVYNPETDSSSVHMALLAGEELLELSYDTKPQGYYQHGEYPFVVAALYRIAGSPFGQGIPDMHGSAQLHSDKLDQIILRNALLASRNKLLVTDASGFDVEDLADWSKEVHQGESLNGITWFTTPPLPAYILNYLQLMRDSIKSESGANDQARGQTSGGVTAASAISMLQSMATKRSSMESESLHRSFKKAVRMMLDVEREFAISDRELRILHDGQVIKFQVTPSQYRTLGDDGKPVEWNIYIETAIHAKYSKLANNELALELGKMFAGSIDPMTILYMMDFKERDTVIEMLEASRKSELVTLRQQNAEMSAAIQQLSEQNKEYANAFAEVQASSIADQYRQQDERQAAELESNANEQTTADEERMLNSML